MNASLLRHLLPLLLCLALGPGLRAADDKAAPAPAPAAKPAADPAKPHVEGSVELPVMKVTPQRLKQLEKEIKRLDKMISRESKNIKSTDLNQALNNEKLSKAAAIFGGNSADHLSAVAASRVGLMEREREILEEMKRPLSADDLALLQAELDQTRETRRNLDDAAKQR